MDNLLKQIRKLNKKNLDNIKLEFDDDSLTEIVLYLTVEEGIHVGKTYKFRIKLNNFLESKPDIICESNVYHPNMINDQKVCCNLFMEDWEEGTTLEGIIAALYCLLENPNFESILNTEVEEANYIDEIHNMSNWHD